MLRNQALGGFARAFAPVRRYRCQKNLQTKIYTYVILFYDFYERIFKIDVSVRTYEVSARIICSLH